MTPLEDTQAIASHLCQVARSNFLAEGAAFDEHSSLGEAGIDSYSLVELVLAAERACGVIVPESELTRENLASIAALASCVARLAGETRASLASPH